MDKASIKPEQDQIKRFQEVARALGCDEDEAAFDVKLKEIAQHKPAKDEEGRAGGLEPPASRS